MILRHSYEARKNLHITVVSDNCNNLHVIDTLLLIGCISYRHLISREFLVIMEFNGFVREIPCLPVLSSSVIL